MAVKEVEYYRKFHSQTYREDVCGHPRITEYKDHQRMNDEDEKIRDGIIDKFGLMFISTRGLDIKKTYFGSDDKINYTFFITNNPDLNHQSSKNKKYETFVCIRKSGSLKDIGESSDLEQFLIEEGFKKSK